MRAGAAGLALIATALILGVFVTVAGTPVADVRIMTALAELRGMGGGRFWPIVTALGDGEVRVTVGLIFAAALVVVRRRWDALLFVGAVAIGLVVNSVLKLMFARPRPDLLSHLDVVTSLSFPSGHAAHSALTYGLIGLVGASLARANVRPAIFLVVIAAIFLIGLSRVVLGVHWPSDVVGGWSLGLGFALVAWAARTRIERRSAYQPQPRRRS